MDSRSVVEAYLRDKLSNGNKIDNTFDGILLVFYCYDLFIQTLLSFKE